MARAIETVARAMAKAASRIEDADWNDERQRWYIDRHWVEFERDAAGLLRDLKGQPPHITDAGDSKFASEALDQMLEAMARS
jgi:hypothetical protein